MDFLVDEMEQANTTELTSLHKPRNMFIDNVLFEAYQHCLLHWSGNYFLFRAVVCQYFYISETTLFHTLATKTQFLCNCHT